MSLHLEFEPHFHYMGFAVYDNRNYTLQGDVGGLPSQYRWHAFIDNGNTYRVDEVKAYDRSELRRVIREYHLKQRNGYGERIAKRRLDALRTELQAERISYGEIAELQALAPYIDSSDVELLEAAGVAEGTL
jgi:hypothetical protein